MITREMAVAQAASLGCEPACVLAVSEVESANSGYLADGRPVILFEAQWFHHFTNGAWDASHPGISSPVWDRSLYKGGAAEWDRLNEAMALNVTAAWESASWGAFQIMGMNFAACGYASVNAFVDAMRGPIDNHLAAFDGFIKSNPTLLRALIAKDWTTFARIYNGPGAVAQYAAKIATAYQIHAREDVAAVVPPPTLDAAVPAPPAPLPPPIIEGPPIPTADPAPPPAGYAETGTGNVVRVDVKQSEIVKGANVGQVVTGAAGAATAAAGAASQFKGLLGGAGDVGIICLTVVAVVAIAAAFFYFRSVKADRIAMNKAGIA